MKIDTTKLRALRDTVQLMQSHLRRAEVYLAIFEIEKAIECVNMVGRASLIAILDYNPKKKGKSK